MSEQSLDRADRRLLLSALMDGEASTAEAAQACQVWRDDEVGRHAWASYQLIGDVLRSEDLAGGTGSDRFLKKLRTQLADEPVVLAPQAAARVAAAAQAAPVHAPEPSAHPAVVSMASRSPRARTWSGPMAVAAAFVAVLGGVLALQSPVGTPAGAPGVVVASGAPGAAGLPGVGANALMTGFGPVTPSMAFGASAVSTAPSFSEQAKPSSTVVSTVADVTPMQAETGDAPFVQQATDRNTDLIWVIR